MPGTHKRLHSDGGVPAIWVSFLLFQSYFFSVSSVGSNPAAREAERYTAIEKI